MWVSGTLDALVGEYPQLISQYLSRPTLYLVPGYRGRTNQSNQPRGYSIYPLSVRIKHSAYDAIVVYQAHLGRIRGLGHKLVKIARSVYIPVRAYFISSVIKIV